MSGLKQKAREAIDHLKDYLSRDREALKLIDAVERYNGQLRRDKAAMLLEIDGLRAAVSSLTKSLNDSNAIAIDMREQAVLANSQCRQTEAALALCQQEVHRLEEILVPPPPPEMTVNETQFWRLFKSVKQRMHKPPSPLESVKFHDDIGYVFALEDFVPNLSDDEFMLLGKFIVVAQLGFLRMVGFTIDSGDPRSPLRRKLGSLAQDRLALYVYWLGEAWIGKPPAYVDKLISPTEQETWLEKHQYRADKGGIIS